MSALHQGLRDDLRIAPNLWAGVGLVRGGAGTALVGNPQQVAERIREYQALGISNFIFSGYPHLEEAHRFAELVMPLLPLENGASSKARSVNTGPFGETIGGDKRRCARSAPADGPERDHETAYRRRAAMSAEPHIVIIGGGFSGAAVAIELLRLAPNGVRVTLLEPRQSPGPGWPTPLRSRRTGLTFRPLACSWPATKRRLRSSVPPSACLYRRCAGAAPDGSVYPQRGQFGRYVAQRFADAAASSGGRLRHLRDRALAFHQGMVTTDGGLQLKADLLVLAISHPPPSLPAQAEAWRHHPALIANPWQPGALDAIAPHARVAVMGTGLTMADTVATLDRLGHRGSIVAFSRHGLLSRGNLSGAGQPGLATISRAACASACARSASTSRMRRSRA